MTNKKSTIHDLYTHCEERRDEAIQERLLRYTRNDRIYLAVSLGAR